MSDEGEIGGYILGELLAYQGKPGCEHPMCTRRGVFQRDDGTWDMGECMGYHCPRCDEPCSMMGHKCKAAA